MFETGVAGFVLLLLVAAVVGVLVQRIPIPYVVALALIGLGAGSLVGGQPFHLTHSLILFVLLPGLLFEAAFHLRWSQLRQNLPAVVLLTTLGVLLTTAITGLLGHLALQLSLPLAILFGAMVSPTDPVAVVAVFRRLGVPERLGNLVEAESLFNDGTGVVLFTIAVSAMGNGNLTVSSAIIDFLRLTVGGVACGLAIGLLLSLVTARIDDPQVEISLTGLASYGGYLVAEYLNFSGILCVVCSALVLGNYGRPRGMSEATQGAVHAFWSYIAFFLNSLIFVLIGLDVPRAGLLQHIGVIGVAAVIVLVARAFTVYGLMALLLPVGRRVNLRWQHLTVWSGIRGAVAVALLLSLDSREADLAQVRDIVYGVVLASIVVQGTTVGALARLLLPRTVGEAAARS